MADVANLTARPAATTELNHIKQNRIIQDTISKQIKDQFPIVGRSRTLDLIESSIDDNLVSDDFPEQKKIKLNRKSWMVPMHGRLRLTDNLTGEVIDETRRVKLANIPKLTNRFSVIIDGNEYQTRNQFRLKPGIYTRVQGNGEIASQFNLEKGWGFQMKLDPKKGIYHLIVKNKKYPLYNILHILGTTDEQMKETWGDELFKKNKEAALPHMEKHIVDLHQKLTKQKATFFDSVAGLKKYFDSTKISPETTEMTLGQSFEKADKALMLRTSKKLLGVMRQEESPDERDSLAFKDLYGVDDLLNAYFDANKTGIEKSIAGRLESKNKIREIVSPSTYSKPIRGFFTQGDLSSTPEQTNPVHILDEWRKTTIMGTGGIGSKHAVTMDTRDLHPSQIGVLDPLNTPESGGIGTVVGLSLGARKQNKNMMVPVVDTEGNKKYLSISEVHKHKVGYPDQIGKKTVKGVHKGIPSEFKKSEIDYYLSSPQEMFSLTSNLIPFLNHNSGNRAMMAGKQMAQAINLVDPDTPLVQSKGQVADTYEKYTANTMNPRVGPNQAGTVTKITEDYIHIKRDVDGKEDKVGLYNKFPLNSDSHLHSTPTVKEGDKVSAGQFLAENNYQKDGSLALGANVNVAYMPWKGYNFEDSIVVTESLAKKLSSKVLIRKNLYTSKTGTFDTEKYLAYFPGKLTKSNQEKLGADGIVAEGQQVDYGDILATYMEPAEYNDEEKLLRNMNRAISSPFRDRTLKWDHHTPGKVVYVRQNGRNLDIHIETVQPLVVGDKLVGRHANKGIISKIIKDDEAPHRKSDGERIDLMISPHGVLGRVNPGQLLETAAGKWAKKSGKTYVVNNFSGEDVIGDLKEKYDKEGLKFDDILTDGKDGPELKRPVFNGVQHILKLEHTVDHKMRARDTGAYDVNLQPSKGGTGAQKVDPLQMYALLAHGAKKNLYEMTAIKGQQNDDYWRALQMGLPTPKPSESFVFNKMINQLKGAGVNVDKKGNNLVLSPLTDKDVEKLSAGELKDAGSMVTAKNLAERADGLFDPKITGGLNGKKWSHIELKERIPNPMYENAIHKVLNLTGPQFDRIISGDEKLGDKTGPKAIVSALKELDVEAELENAKKELVDAKPTKVNKLNKKVRYLEALKKSELSAHDAYSMSKVPVLPPFHRPLYPLPSGDLMSSPINYHYRDVALLNKSVGNVKEAGLDEEFNKKNNAMLYKGVKAMQGFTDPVTYTKEKYAGLVAGLAGSSPKFGFVQDKAWSKKQDLTARSTITLEPSLGIDEVGLPEDVAKVIYRPLVTKKLVQQGYKVVEARKHATEFTPVAEVALKSAMSEHPVILNRAPSLHKHSVQGFEPVLMKGKSIRLNPLILGGFNADFDGDTMSVHVPIGTEAISEARSIMPSRILFKHGDKGIVPGISWDYLVGLYYLTKPGEDTGKTFTSPAEALEDGLDMRDIFTLRGMGKTSLGKIAVNEVLPTELRDYDRVIDKKELGKLLDKVAKEHQKDFEQVINSLKDLGNQYSHKRGGTISVTDLDVDRKYRDTILEEYKEKVSKTKDKDKKIELWTEATSKIQDAQNKAVGDDEVNNIYSIINAGSAKGPDQARQLLSLPGVMTDVKGKPIEVPILRSYSEGLDTYDYWNQLYGARKGGVDRAVNTEKSGALNKVLLGLTKSVLVSEEDCGTTRGNTLATDDKNIYDRVIMEPIKGVAKKGDVVNGEVIDKAVEKDVKEIKVRSPLTCDSEVGICKLCYGLMPDGTFPDLGTNVGILESQALTERSTQLTMRTFHTGGTATGGGGSDILSGFPRTEQILYVPEKLPGKATLATLDGKITAINDTVTGAKEIVVGEESHIVTPGIKPIVTIGQTVGKGDKLSEGVIKPQELGALKSHLDAQKYMVNELDGIYDGSFNTKTFETVIRGVTNNAEVTKAPSDAGVIRGDTTSISKLEKLNKERKEQGLDPVEYKPYFKSVQTLSLDKDDWLSRLGTRYLKNTIQEGAATGMASNIHGHDPIPGYLYAEEFGKGDATKGEFY